MPKHVLQLFCLASVFVACGGEEKKPLFNEAGVWSLQRYDIGQGYKALAPAREDSFLLRFDPPQHFVAAGSCSTVSGGTVENSACATATSEAEWHCRCFAYTFEESLMVWQEYNPGDPIPMVMAPMDTTGGPCSDTDDLAMCPSHEVEVAVFNPDTPDFKLFQPLPQSLFQSDGVTSGHVFLRKADAVWEAHEGAPEELAACWTDCGGL